MRIWKVGHSCVVLEEGGERLLIDPGTYTFTGSVKPEHLSGISYIAITHEHADHCDPVALRLILASNKEAKVLGNAGVRTVLEKERIPITLFEEGEEKLGRFLVRAIPAEHEKIFRPPSQNTAFLISNVFLHPGDSLDPKLVEEANGLLTLALPVSAPWGTQLQMGEFAKKLNPHVVIPIHDGMVKDFALVGLYERYKEYLSESGIVFRPMNHTEDFAEI